MDRARLAGQVWVDGSTLRFRSLSGSNGQLDVAEEVVAGLRFTDDGELHLEMPRGGWWSRGRLDIDLGDLDRIRFRGAVPWRRDGLVTVEVAGRRPVHLWVADIRRLEQALTGTGEDLADGSGVGGGERD